MDEDYSNDDYDGYAKHQEEWHFARLFEKCLKTVMTKWNVSKDRFVKAIEFVTKRYDANHYSLKKRWSDIDFYDIYNLCAHFYRASPLSAGLVRHRVTVAVNNCEQFRSYLQNLSGFENNVVSLGGGAGCDLIGFCSAVYGIVDCKKLDLTVVDKEEGWELFFEALESVIRDHFRDAPVSNCSFKSLEVFRDCGVCLSFIRQDLSPNEKLNDAYTSVLKKADVILMNSFFSVLPKSDSFTVAVNVCLEMKVGAVLLFIDVPDFDFCQLGLEMIYTSANDGTSDDSSGTPHGGIYEFEKYAAPKNIYGTGFAMSSSAQISVYMKKTE